MAGWPLVPAGPSLDVFEILRKLQSVGFCSNLDPSGTETGCEKLSSLFDRIWLAFSREINRRDETRPLPAMVGPGHPVDLCQLYSVVQEMGGFDQVTENSAWASVAQAIGLEVGFGSSLKLVFFKYLDTLDRWLQRVTGKKAVGERSGYKNLRRLNARRSFRAITDHGKMDCESPMPSSSKKDQFLSPVKGSGCRLQFDADGLINGDVVISGKGVGNGGFNHLKRKREDLMGMLNWVRNTAKNPNLYSVGKLAARDCGKGKGPATSEHYAQALLSRQALFLKIIRQTSPEATHQQKGRPFIYENGNGTISHTEIEFNQQLQSASKKSNSRNCYETLILPDDDKDNKGLMGVGEASDDMKHRPENPSLDSDGWLSGDQQLMQTPVGTNFQAEVPVWTGQPSVSITDSDELKWLGTRIWPPEGQQNTPSIDNVTIGMGRQDNCQCEWPGSVECIRFHIAEKRLQLKRELGPAFHAWGFRTMGEEVALSWTEEEEWKFKAIVRSNRPSLDKNFWNQLYLYFPLKKRTSLVSYYFNVFLIGCRRYQNRVTHNNIDSDDEETEFSFLSNHFGKGAVRIHDPMSFICAQNMQCMDLDD